MRKRKLIVYLLSFMTLSLSNPSLARADSGAEGEDTGYSEFTNAIPGLTHIESWPLLEGGWFGPLYIKNGGSEPLELMGYLSNCECLQVINMPESIAAGESGTIEVIFTPETVGLYTARLTLTTNQGEKRVTLRANVVSDNPFSEYGLKWRNTSSYDSERQRFLYPVEDLLKDLKKTPNDWMRMIVDPRSNSLFIEGHAPGAINLSLHELTYREDLRQRRIFIIDSGLRDISILNDIRRLETQGFEQLFWVEGGLAYWKDAGGTIEGKVETIEQWRLVAPSQLYNSLLRPEFLILNCSDPEEKFSLEGIFPQQTVLNWEASGKNQTKDAEVNWHKSVIDEIRQASGIRKSAPPVLLIGEKGQNLSRVVSELTAEGIPLVFQLNGNVEELKRYLSSVKLPKSEKLYTVRSGAKNPNGKIAPRKLTDNDCADCP